LTLSGEWFDESIVLFNVERSVMFALEGSRQRIGSSGSVKDDGSPL
jgi:hypothetical protein